MGESKCRVGRVNPGRIGRQKKAAIDLLSDERAAQLNFLQTVVKVLNAIPQTGIKAPERTAILAGAMYIVREQIGQEYSKNTLSRDDIPTSVIHKGLSKILNAKTTSPENIETLVHSTNKFMMYMTTESQKIRAEHVFSHLKDFSLDALVVLTQKIIKTCRSVALETAVQGYKRHLELVKSAEEEGGKTTKKPATAAPSITAVLGTMLFGAFAAPKPQTKAKAETSVEKDAEDTQDVTATMGSGI